MEQIIDHLGIEFGSTVSKDFGKDVEKVINDLQEKFKKPLSDVQSVFKSLSVTVATFFNTLKATPVIDLANMVSTKGIVEKGASSFKELRKQSVAEFEKMHSDISSEINSLVREFTKVQDILTKVRAGENPVVSWGQPEMRKGTPTFPNAVNAIDRETVAMAPDDVVRAERERVITQYAQRQLEIYQQMEGLVGRMGAFERARVATSELIATELQKETQARANIAEFVKVTQDLLSRGMLTEGTTDKKLQGAKQYLDEVFKTTKDVEVVNQEIDNIIKNIVKDEGQIKDIVMQSLGVKKEELLTTEKIAELAKQITEQYAQAKAASGGGGGGPVGGDEWKRLIGTIELAKVEVDKFQLALQQINMRGYINGDEFQRVSSIAKAMTSDIDRMANELSRLGSQSGAKQMASDFTALDTEIKQLSADLKAGVVQNLDGSVKNLADRLRLLSVEANKVQLQAISVGMEKVNSEIQQLTKGADITIRSLKQMGLGTLELEKLQGLLAERMRLVRQEFQLTGQSTAAMNAQMKATGEALVYVQHQQTSFAGRTGDALRAMDRWGAGFGAMLKSQLAWMAGGALIFGTVFKIQSAITETISTMMKFSQAMVDVGAITEASASDMVVMEKAAREVATSTKLGFLEAAEAMKILGQAGLSARESAATLKTVAMLVTATGASSQEAVKVLTTAMNVWNIGAKEAARVGNVLAAALNYSKLEIGDLSVAFNYVAATAAQVGMSIEETAASIAVLSNAGIRASTIGTGLRGILGQLIAPTKAFRDQIEAVGLKMKDIQMPGHTLIEVLRKLQTAGFDLGNIFEGLEKRQAGAMAAMLGMGSAAFQEMTDRLTGTNAMMVMFDRSMEGPVNRLIVLKNRLIDIGISLSSTLIPGLNLLVGALGAVTIAVKDLLVIIVGGALIGGFKYLSAVIETAAGAITRFGVALAWLGKHPILVGISLLVAGYAALHGILESTNKAQEEKIQKEDKELSLLARQIADYESLNALVKSGTVSRKDMADKVAEMAEAHKELNKMIKEGVLDEEQFVEALKNLKKKFDDLKLTHFTSLLVGMEDADRRLKKLQGDLNVRYQEWSKQNKGDFETFLKATGLDQTMEHLRSTYRNADDSVRAAARGMKTYKDEAIQTAAANAGVSRSIMDVGAEYVNAFRDMGKEPTWRSKPTADELKNLSEWEKKSADDLKKLQLERKEALSGLGKDDLSRLEGDALIKATQTRDDINKYYNEKEKELREKQLQKKLNLEKKYQGYLDEMAREDLANKLTLAKKELDELIRIDKVLAIERAEVWEKYTKRRDTILADKDLVKNKPLQQKLLDDAQTQLKASLEAKDDQAEEDRKKIREKRELERISWEKKIGSELLNTQKETVNNEIAVAKSGADKLAGIDKAIELELAEATEKNKANKERIVADMMTALHKPGVDVEKVIADTNRVLEGEDQRYLSEREKIYYQGLHRINDIWDENEKERIKKVEKALTVDLDLRTRSQKEELKVMQEKYDSLSETDRQSEYGKNLKYKMDILTVSISKNSIAIYENQLALELYKAGKETDFTVKLRDDIDRLTDKLKSARQEMTKYQTEHGNVWQGMEEGAKSFINGLKTSFQIGEDLAKGFGKSVYDSIHSVFEDLFTGQLKTWQDYWESFLKSLGRLWANTMTEMVFQFIGLKQLTGGGAAGGMFGGFSIVGLLQSIFGGGGFSASQAARFASGDMLQGWGYTGHAGGIVSKHSGGLASDEVLSKLLTNEYVMKRDSARMIGRTQLDYMNATGKIPPGGDGGMSRSQIEIIPSPLFDAKIRSMRPTPEEMEASIAISISKGGPLRGALQKAGAIR